MENRTIFVRNCREQLSLIQDLSIDNPLFGRNYLYFNYSLKSSSSKLVPLTVYSDSGYIMNTILESFVEYIDGGWNESDIPNKVVVVSDGELFIERVTMPENFTKNFRNKFKFIFWNITNPTLEFKQVYNNVFKCSGISGEIIKKLL